MGGHTGVREHVVAERAELVGLLAGLDEEQWRTPSLCGGWTVRDVAAHLSLDTVTQARYARMFLRRPIPDAFNDHWVASQRDVPTDVLVAGLAESARSSWFTRYAPRIALADHVVHQQDIRRPLGLPRTIDPERLRLLLGRPDPFAFPFRFTRGLTFVATDLDWRHGSGPEVTGPGESLALAMVGRPIVLDELSGPGVPTLRARMA
jgi:uncharacterized protein (TIGR03083 family)